MHELRVIIFNLWTNLLRDISLVYNAEILHLIEVRSALYTQSFICSLANKVIQNLYPESKYNKIVENNTFP